MFDLDAEIRKSKKKLRLQLNTAVKKNLVAMAKSRKNKQVVTVTVVDRDHFYRIVHYCTKHYGHGSHCWTTAGRVLRFVDPARPSYNPPRIIDFIIYTPGADVSQLPLL